MTHPITINDIETVIEGQEVQISSDELDDILVALQEDFEDFWSDHMATVEDGSLKLVAECDEALVFADHTGRLWKDQFDAVIDFSNLLGVEVDKTPETVLAAHHTAAHRLTDYNWATANPVVINKPADFDRGVQFVEAVINSLIFQGLSPGQAWAFYGVLIRGNSRNSWAQRCGYSDHSAVSEAVRKGKEKLDLN